MAKFLNILKEHRRLISQILLYVAVWFIIFWATSTKLDPDFGWHLMSGQHIATHGIPNHALFTYTMPNFEWINHEWLSDVIMSYIYQLGGYTLLVIFFSSLWTLALWLASRRHLWFAVLLGTITLLPIIGVRPIIWTALGFVILERLLTSTSRLKYISIILLLWAWANLHGSFALGLVLLIVTASLQKPFSKPLGLTVIIAILATFINPYGWHLYIEIFRTMLDPMLSSRIIEWQSMTDNWAFWIYSILLIATFVVTENHKKQWKFAIPGSLLIMAINTQRQALPFVLSSVRYLEEYGSQVILQVKPKVRLTMTALGAITIIILLSIYGMRSAIPYNDFYPAEGVKYLNQNPCTGRIFNDYTYGGYLIWKLPDTPTYIDGRMPSWSDNNGSIFDRYVRVFDDPEYRQSEFSKYQIKCVLVSKSFTTKESREETITNLSQDLQARGWKISWENKDSLLLTSQP